MTTAPRGQRLLMAAAIVVATAAGIVGAIMLIAPSSTGRYFAWPLGPQALAALVGGFYVVSAPVFAYAGRRPAIDVRGLAAAVLAFTIPTLAATYLHRDVFDFDRLFATRLGRAVRRQPGDVRAAALDRSPRPAPARDPRVQPAARIALAALGLAFAGLAVWFWVTVSGPVPFEVAPLGARFLAAWLAFFAVLAAWPAMRPARSEARVPLLALIAYGIGGLLAVAVHPQELGPGAAGYVAGLLIVASVPALVLARGTPR